MLKVKKTLTLAFSRKHNTSSFFPSFAFKWNLFVSIILLAVWFCFSSFLGLRLNINKQRACFREISVNKNWSWQMFKKQQRLVFKETVVRVLHQWGSETWKFGLSTELIIKCQFTTEQRLFEKLMFPALALRPSESKFALLHVTLETSPFKSLYSGQ